MGYLMGWKWHGGSGYFDLRLALEIADFGAKKYFSCVLSKWLLQFDLSQNNVFSHSFEKKL
jgi:hypothetical protein